MQIIVSIFMMFLISLKVFVVCKGIFGVISATVNFTRLEFKQVFYARSAKYSRYKNIQPLHHVALPLTIHNFIEIRKNTLTT